MPSRQAKENRLYEWLLLFRYFCIWLGSRMDIRKKNKNSKNNKKKK